ncbi:MAG: hypothetical protein E3J72_18170 [Planctomycetota bacterium]|nr:MAG: hypothetical protein E3J72_18170 [Planctomycetota bacterium]
MADSGEIKVISVADSNFGSGAVDVASYLLQHFAGWGGAKVEFDTEAGPSVWIEREGSKLFAEGTDTAALAAVGASEVLRIAVHPESAEEVVRSIREEFTQSTGVVALGVVLPNADVNVLALNPGAKPDKAVIDVWENVGIAVFPRGRVPDGLAESYFGQLGLSPVPILPLGGDLVNIVRAKVGLL